MLELLIVVVRGLALVLRGHRELVLENVALRQQLAAMQRAQKRVRLNTRDRLFWIALAHGWRNWRTALLFVQPDTVVCWHRDWLRRRWTRRIPYGARRGFMGSCGVFGRHDRAQRATSATHSHDL
ncbi:MAG TPA: hypothetical protein VKE51_23410 [Vicinamibacterales bacterium]|nr:hypothetical protein [Vicinamibacterales bacterium]